MKTESVLSDRAVLSGDLQAAMAKSARCPDCADKDEDCAEVPDKVKCWLYAPERGMCPYLRGDK